MGTEQGALATSQHKTQNTNKTKQRITLSDRIEREETARGQYTTSSIGVVLSPYIIYIIINKERRYLLLFRIFIVG